MLVTSTVDSVPRVFVHNSTLVYEIGMLNDSSDIYEGM